MLKSCMCNELDMYIPMHRIFGYIYDFLFFFRRYRVAEVVPMCGEV